MNQDLQDRLNYIDELIDMYEAHLRDLKNERNKIILKGENHE